MNSRTVFLGVGGAGSRLSDEISENLEMKNIESISIDTDREQIECLKNTKKILIGEETAKGLGAKGNIATGEKAAAESLNEIKKILSGARLLFLAAGMGGGTGTGAMPLIAKTAKENKATVIAITILPYRTEDRTEKALYGINKLREYTDTIIVLDNNKLEEYFPQMTKEEKYKLLNSIIIKAVSGITKTTTENNLINADLSEINSVMNSGDIATISFGSGKGTNKIKQASDGATEYPLLEITTKDVKSAFIYINSCPDLSISDLCAIEAMISLILKPEANLVILKSTCDKTEDYLEVITIFTGIKELPF